MSSPSIAVVTPLLVTDKWRRRNWKVTHAHIKPMLRALRIPRIVVESQGEYGGRTGCRRLALPGRFSRSRAMNYGWRATSEAFVAFADADVVMRPADWEQAFVECQNHDVYSPYRCGIKLGSAATASVLDEFAVRWDQISQRPEQWNLCGGIVFFKRSALEAVDGWDERFTGWGYEDSAMQRRVRNLSIGWGTGIGVHLWHPGSHRGRDRERNYRLLRKLYG